MTVGVLLQLLEILPECRCLIVQDPEGDAVLKLTGVWIPPDPTDPIQITTEVE